MINEATQSRETISLQTFRGPFRLAGYDEVFPPGSYSVIARDAVHEGNAHTAYVRTATILVVKSAGLTRHCEVDPVAFEAAVERDKWAVLAPTKERPR